MNNINSTIERLPTELLIELFEYIPPYELYKSFFNLNSRFNFLINSLTNFHFTFHEDWDAKWHIVPFFASQISTLIIKHDELIDFSYYTNIRSLKLSMPTAYQCTAIQPYLLPNLENLYISNLYYSDNSEELCRLIFSPLFSRLRTCQIDRMTFTNSDSCISESLRQLTISPCTWKSNMYIQILNACPNLISLRIKRLRNISFELRSNLVYKHRSLRYLKIQFCSIGNEWYKQIDWLLSMVPNLENFTLFIEQNDTNLEFPFDLLARLLMQYVPHLINLKIKTPLNKFLSIELHSIQQLHPLFNYVQFQGYITRDLSSYLLISSEK